MINSSPDFRIQPTSPFHVILRSEFEEHNTARYTFEAERFFYINFKRLEQIETWLNCLRTFPDLYRLRIVGSSASESKVFPHFM